ncbi:MAG TPA: DEAD/DEAH box helicase, partial [Sphaerochaeta sp.]|nr:DEAD/DEAH box helicase [Sphaerochaeta sp.]
MERLLYDLGFTEEGRLTYNDSHSSLWYANDSAIVIIDSFACTQELPLFDYRQYTIEQNKLMRKGLPLYRFLSDEDPELVAGWLTHTLSFAETYQRTADRGRSAVDASALEHSFEERFTEVYGSDALAYLHREYPLPSPRGTTFYLDYLVQYTDGSQVAVEENGVSFHHPQLIGTDRYRKQLEKQNSAAYHGITLYRFSSMDLAYPKVIDDQIRLFFGDRRHFQSAGLLAERFFTLYDHQKEALEEIWHLRASLPGPHAVLKVFPTATGKSKIVEEDLAAYFTQHPDAAVLVVAPSRRIVADWLDRLKVFPKSVGEGEENQIIVGTYYRLWSLQKHYSPEYFSYIVFDEAHHAVAPVTQRNLQYWQPGFLIGLTATDERLDNRRLEEVFGSYTTSLTLSEAMEQQIIATVRAYRVESNLSLAEVRFNGKEYVNADLERTIVVDSRNHLIADVLAKYFNQKQKGIIFCVSVAHAHAMERILTDRGFVAKAVSGKTRGMEEIVEEFRYGELQFLCSCSLLNEGWDVPEVEVLVMARPTISKLLYQQQLGRGLRRSKNKRELFVIDVVDQYGALARPWSVNALFAQPLYVPFGDILRTYQVGDKVEVLGLAEEVRALIPIDITTFEDQYAEYFSEEQSARELYISTSTLKNWMRKGEVEADLKIPFGKRSLAFFHPDSLEDIRKLKGLSVHDDTTLREDFFAFIDEKSYTFSFKIIFLLALLR